MSHTHSYDDVFAAVYEPEPIPDHATSLDEVEYTLRGVVTYRCSCGDTETVTVTGVSPADVLSPA